MGGLLALLFFGQAVVQFLRELTSEQLGGKAWKAYNADLKRQLIADQIQGGSWPAKGPWGKVGGPVLSTALGALSLEVYYRYGRSR